MKMKLKSRCGFVARMGMGRCTRSPGDVGEGFEDAKKKPALPPLPPLESRPPYPRGEPEPDLFSRERGGDLI